MDFESYLINKNDEIDNSVFALINAFVRKDGDTDVKWNMEVIGEIEEVVEDILTSRYFDICHPFYSDDNIPCYKSDDCWNEACLFKRVERK